MRVAVDAKLESDRTSEQRRRELYAAHMQMADQLWSSPSGSQRRIEELLSTWIPLDDSQEDLREFSWRYQWTRLHQSAALTVVDTSAATLNSHGNLLTADANGITEWDAVGTAPTLRWSGDASHVTLSPDGHWAAVHFSEIISLIDITRGESVIEVPHDRCVFSADSQFLAAWTANVEVESLEPDEVAIQVWSLAKDEPQQTEPLVLKRIKTLPTDARRIQLDNDGRSFLLQGVPKYWRVAAYLDELPDPVSWGHGGAVCSCAFSQDGQLIASGNTTGMVRLSLRSDPTEKLVIGSHGGGVAALRFSPDGMKLAAGGFNGTIDIWDVSALRQLSKLPEPKAIASGDATDGVPADNETSTRPRLAPSAHTPRLLRTIKAHLHAVRSITFSTDGTRLASRDADGVSKLWDWQNVDGRHEVKDMGEELLDGYVAFSFDNQDGGVVVTEVPPQQEIVSGSIQVGDRITGISNDPTGPVKDFAGMDANDLIRFVGGDAHNTLFRLRIQSPGEDERHVQLRRSLKLSPRSMQLAFSTDGKTLAIADQKVGAASLNLATGKMRRYSAFGNSVAISPNGRMLALDDWYEVLLWDLQLDREHARLKSRVAANPVPGNNAAGGTLAFSPDGNYLAMGTGYRYAFPPRSDLKVWQLSTLEEIGPPLFENDCTITCVAFTPPDGSHLVAADTTGLVRIWDTTTWKLERTIDRGSRIYSLAISPDGRTLATGGDKRTVLWDFETGTKLHVLDSATDAVLAFSPDGRTLVSGDFDHNVVLWDVASGLQLRTFDAHTDSVFGVSFSPDGNILATVGSEGVLRLWEAAAFDEIDRHPATLDSMLRLGRLRNEQERYAEAQAILRRLLQLQEEQLPADHEDIVQTRAEIETAIRGNGEVQGKPPPDQALE